MHGFFDVLCGGLVLLDQRACFGELIGGQAIHGIELLLEGPIGWAAQQGVQIAMHGHAGGEEFAAEFQDQVQASGLVHADMDHAGQLVRV